MLNNNFNAKKINSRKNLSINNDNQNRKYNLNNNNINIKAKTEFNKKNNNDENSDLSELVDEFIEAFNIEIDNSRDEENYDTIKKAKSSNIQNNKNINNKNDNNFYVSSFQNNKSRSKEININNAKNISKVSPRFTGNKIQNKNKKVIKPFKESFQLDESLIHDSELDIPLILETLIYNKVMMKKKFDEIDMKIGNEKRDNDNMEELFLNKNDDNDYKIDMDKNKIDEKIKNIQIEGINETENINKKDEPNLEQEKEDKLEENKNQEENIISNNKKNKKIMNRKNK